VLELELDPQTILSGVLTACGCSMGCSSWLRRMPRWVISVVPKATSTRGREARARDTSLAARMYPARKLCSGLAGTCFLDSFSLRRCCTVTSRMSAFSNLASPVWGQRTRPSDPWARPGTCWSWHDASAPARASSPCGTDRFSTSRIWWPLCVCFVYLLRLGKWKNDLLKNFFDLSEEVILRCWLHDDCVRNVAFVSGYRCFYSCTCRRESVSCSAHAARRKREERAAEPPKNHHLRSKLLLLSHWDTILSPAFSVVGFSPQTSFRFLS